MGQQVFSTPGATTFDRTAQGLPEGWDITVQVWGGGGGGKGGNVDPSGGGGGGGGYASSVLQTVAGTDDVTVGAVGSAGTDPAGNGGDGGESWFRSATTVRAAGGSGSTGTAGAAGGAGSHGTTLFTGGNGGAGGTHTSQARGGGGGGGSAGSAANGNVGAGNSAGTGGAGGAAVTDGGVGGDGGTAPNANGNAPVSGWGGGGGGGSNDQAGTGTAGGAGAAGRVVVTWDDPPTDLSRDILAENVKLSEVAEPSPLSSDLVVEIIAESVNLQDLNQGATQLVGTLRIADEPPIAQLEEGTLSSSQSDGFRITESIAASLVTLLLLGAPADASLRISDSVQASRDLDASITETLNASEDLSVSQDVSAVVTEEIRLSDSLTRTLDPLLVSLLEDSRITDTPSAAIVSASDLSASLSDSLTLVDLGQGATQLLGVIHITDTVVAERVDVGGGELSASVAENFKIQDGSNPGTTLFPLSAVLAETLRLADAEDSWAELSTPELLRLSDSIQAAISLSASVQESLAVDDEDPSATRVDGGALTASLQEDVKVFDALTAELATLLASLTESIRLSDIVQAAVNLSVTVTEQVKAADTATAQLALLQASLQVESLQASDSVQASLDIGAAVQENAKISDVLTAALTLLQASPQEDLKLADQASAARIDAGTLAFTGQESIVLQDVVLAQITPLQGTATENLLASDAASAQLAQLVATAQEGLKVSDAVAAERIAVGGLAAFMQDGLRIADVLTAVLDPLQAGVSEALAVVDGPTSTLMDMSVLVTENVKVSDADLSAALIEAGALAHSGQEVLHIGEDLATSLNPLQGASGESARISDAVQSALDLSAVLVEPLRVSDVALPALDLSTVLVEALAVADAVQAVEDPLEASSSEDVRLSDAVIVRGLSRLSIISGTGSFVKTIEGTGSFTKTVEGTGSSDSVEGSA